MGTYWGAATGNAAAFNTPRRAESLNGFAVGVVGKLEVGCLCGLASPAPSALERVCFYFGQHGPTLNQRNSA